MVFEGGINEEDLDSLVEGLSNGEATHLRAKLIRQGHTRKDPGHDLPENRGAIRRTYTKMDAERWIAEYEEAISETLKDDDS